MVELCSVALVSWLLTASVSAGGEKGDGSATPTTGQEAGPEPAAPEAQTEPPDQQQGRTLPSSDKLRISIRFMAGYGLDESQATLGYEKQGRVGYAVVDLRGRLSPSVSYVLSVNPVSENQPLPTCGEPDYFFPNTPQSFGPNVACDNNGRLRVDDYRFLALDPLLQQGPIREGYIQYMHSGFGVKGGRFILPIGFGWEEVGSFSAKDATHIQRINAEASFGIQFHYTKQRQGRRWASISAAGVLGDGNKYHDYNYFYGIEGSLDSNSWPTMVLSGSIEPLRQLELRAALKRGHTGSKVERLPNFFASKRNDYATVISTRYQPVRHVTVFGEAARYTWGLVPSSAELLDLPYSGPVEKNGYYYGVDASYPVLKNIRIGTVLTREVLSRDDALIQWLSAQNMYGVSMGEKERATGVRFYADFGAVRIGGYRNNLLNRFPWVSGIQPVTGERAYTGRGNDKWGVVVLATIQ